MLSFSTRHNYRIFGCLLVSFSLLWAAQSLICHQNFCDNNDCCCNCTSQGCYLRAHISRETNKLILAYGCLPTENFHIPNAGVCKEPVGNYSYELGLYCCDNEDFCNQNLTVYYQPSSTANAISLSSSHSISPSLSLENPPSLSLSIVIPVTIIGTCVILVPCMAIIVGLVILIRKSGSKSRGRRRIHNSSTTPNHITNNINNNKCHLHENSYYTQHNVLSSYSSTSMEPVHISLTNDMSYSSSGSGAGMPFLVKRTIARSITLGEPIGSGRFGQVFLGYHQGERYAVKKFFTKDENSWFHESDIYNTFNLRHENILTCFATDVLSNNGVTELWLITQYYPRGSLYEEFHQNTISSESALKILVSSLRGLIYLHTELAGTQGKPSIAHRDIKSKNILVKNDDTCCIADFGMAIVDDNTFPTFKEPKKVQEGTKRYMPPEILTGTINVKIFESFLRGDVYSFGLVMWEVARMCSTNPDGSQLEYNVPFYSQVPHDPTIEEMKEIIVDQDMIPDIPTHWEHQNELHEGLVRMMKECWYRDPAARPTALYLRKKLDKLAESCEIKLNLS